MHSNSSGMVDSRQPCLAAIGRKASVVRKSTYIMVR